jgi:TonB family protein
VQAIRLSGDRLLLDGKRIGFGWQGQTRKNFNTGELLHIEVEFPEAATEAAAATALQKIFVNRNDDPGSYLPELWAGYFGNPTQTAPKPAPTAMEKPSHDPLPTSMTADPLKATLALRETPRIRQSSGVVAGRLEKNVAPVYPELAKQWGLQGKVALACVIGKDGRVQKLTVAKPAGLGLDEAAAAAVQKWKYKPYIFNGQAMEVDSVIVITFKLRGTNEPTTLGSN